MKLKTQFFPVLAFLLMSGSVYANDFLSGSPHIRSGDQVAETYDSISLRTVEAVAEDGLILLSDGKWYHPQYIARLLTSYNGIGLNDEVLENHDRFSVRNVDAITETGLFLLSDSTWYVSRYLHPIVDRYDIHKTGDTVVESYNSRSVREIEKISNNGKFLLSDGTWYDLKYVNQTWDYLSVNRGRSGGGSLHIDEGDEVLETYRSFSKRTVELISSESGGLLLLSDGSWYAPKYIQAHVPHIKGIYPGDRVVETFNDRSIRTVEATFSGGFFLLSDGTYYAERWVQRIR